MSNSSSNSSSGIGFGGMLAILFIGLKLGRVITWPWIWVLVPIWGPLALFSIIAILVVLSIALFGKKKNKSKFPPIPRRFR